MGNKEEEETPATEPEADDDHAFECVESDDRGWLTVQYQVVSAAVAETNRRLDWLRLVFLFFNAIVLAGFAPLSRFLLGSRSDFDAWGSVDMGVMPFLVLLTGMLASLVWVAMAMRFQLSLKLHYFQLRSLERRLGTCTTSFVSAAATYWSGKKLESPDGAETLEFSSGADSRLGKIALRVWAWALPVWFFMVYVYLFIAVALNETPLRLLFQP